MAIPSSIGANFDTMKTACRAGDLSLMECVDKDGNPVYIVCMMNRYDDGDIEFVPVAKMFTGNPYEEVFPPEESV